VPQTPDIPGLAVAGRAGTNDRRSGPASFAGSNGQDARPRRIRRRCSSTLPGGGGAALLGGGAAWAPCSGGYDQKLHRQVLGLLKRLRFDATTQPGRLRARHVREVLKWAAKWRSVGARFLAPPNIVSVYVVTTCRTVAEDGVLSRLELSTGVSLVSLEAPHIWARSAACSYGAGLWRCRSAWRDFASGLPAAHEGGWLTWCTTT